MPAEGRARTTMPVPRIHGRIPTQGSLRQPAEAAQRVTKAKRLLKLNWKRAGLVMARKAAWLAFNSLRFFPENDHRAAHAFRHKPSYGISRKPNRFGASRFRCPSSAATRLRSWPPQIAALPRADSISVGSPASSQPHSRRLGQGVRTLAFSFDWLGVRVLFEITPLLRRKIAPLSFPPQAPHHDDHRPTYDEKAGNDPTSRRRQLRGCGKSRRYKADERSRKDHPSQFPRDQGAPLNAVERYGVECCNQDRIQPAEIVVPRNNHTVGHRDGLDSRRRPKNTQQAKKTQRA